MKLACLLLLAVGCAPAAAIGDPRLVEVVYDAGQVVAIPVKRGVVTLVVLAADERIMEVGSGLGADCARAQSTWCVAAQPGGRTLFVKPRSAAAAANTLAVVTDRRVHSLRFEVRAEADPRPPVYRLSVKAPPAPPAVEPPALLPLQPLPAQPPVPTPEQLVAQRMQAAPQVLNSHYSLAQGRDSQDIVPTLVFDDGRFTYLGFPGNRVLPAVFHVLADGTETLANVRMEDDLLVIDQVSRRLVLRSGSAVVGLWNDAFDLQGIPPRDWTTVPGVRRIARTAGAVASGPVQGDPR